LAFIKFDFSSIEGKDLFVWIASLLMYSGSCGYVENIFCARGDNLLFSTTLAFFSNDRIVRVFETGKFLLLVRIVALNQFESFLNKTKN
jgi:hypothetical protein